MNITATNIIYPAIAAALIPLAVWGMDMRIQQQMGTVVEDQMDRREIQYLEHQKRNRELTTQEKRDLDFYKEQLRIRQIGGMSE